jgi:predicted RNase H-like nuclease (RuvC/YqgF family)
MLTGLWYQHQRELDERDERIADLELIISNNKHEINELRSQLDQYQAIFSVYQSINKYHHTDNEHHRHGVSASPSTLCKLIQWEKSNWYVKESKTVHIYVMI